MSAQLGMMLLDAVLYALLGMYLDLVRSRPHKVQYCDVQGSVSARPCQRARPHGALYVDGSTRRAVQ